MAWCFLPIFVIYTKQYNRTIKRQRKPVKGRHLFSGAARTIIGNLSNSGGDDKDGNRKYILLPVEVFYFGHALSQACAEGKLFVLTLSLKRQSLSLQQRRNSSKFTTIYVIISMLFLYLTQQKQMLFYNFQRSRKISCITGCIVCIHVQLT